MQFFANSSVSSFFQETLPVFLIGVKEGLLKIEEWAVDYLAAQDLLGLFIVLINVIISLFVLRILILIFSILVNVVLGHTRKPFSAINPDGKKILIIGDSTAVGVGAINPKETITGRLHHDFPRTEIINAAKSGSKLKNALEQLGQYAHSKFNLILISSGGNDVFFGSLKGIDVTLRSVLKKSIELSNGHVIVLLYNNVDEAPLFPFFIRPYVSKRTRRLREVYKEICAEMKVPCIELYTEDSHNPFLDNPKKYFARDGIHPSGEGYSLWYKRMWAEMVRGGHLFYE